MNEETHEGVSGNIDVHSQIPVAIVVDLQPFGRSLPINVALFANLITIQNEYIHACMHSKFTWRDLFVRHDILTLSVLFKQANLRRQLFLENDQFIIFFSKNIFRPRSSLYAST